MGKIDRRTRIDGLHAFLSDRSDWVGVNKIINEYSFNCGVAKRTVKEYLDILVSVGRVEVLGTGKATKVRARVVV